MAAEMRGLMSFKILHFAFMLFGLLQRGKCAQIAALACFSFLLARIQTVLSGFEFANHGR